MIWENNFVQQCEAYGEVAPAAASGEDQGTLVTADVQLSLQPRERFLQ